MSFRLDPLPDVFMRVIWAQIARQIEMPREDKQRLLAAALRECREGSGEDAAVRKIAREIAGVEWRWPQGAAFLEASGAKVTPREMIRVLFRKLAAGAHQMYRRGQMRAVLQGQAHYYRIEVFTADDVAPCGRKFGDQMNATPELIKEMPPCDRLDCCCDWSVTWRDDL